MHYKSKIDGKIYRNVLPSVLSVWQERGLVGSVYVEVQEKPEPTKEPEESKNTKEPKKK